MIAYLLIKTSRNLKGQLDKELKKSGVTSAQFAVMNQIASMGNHVLAYEIASELGSDRPTVSAIIQRLFKANLLIRTENRIDRRTQYIELTTKGLKTLEELRMIANNLSENIFGQLDEKRRIQLLSELNQINKNLEAYDG